MVRENIYLRDSNLKKRKIFKVLRLVQRKLNCMKTLSNMYKNIINFMIHGENSNFQHHLFWRYNSIIKIDFI